VQSLEASCEFALIRDRLAEVRDEAVRAVGRIGGLWREGRLRHGGFALSEVLVYDFAMLVNEVIWGIAAADALASLQARSLEAQDRPGLTARMTAILPAAGACMAARPEQAPVEPALVSR
jgi:hypothetical protein